jgi:hypothetical protein
MPVSSAGSPFLIYFYQLSALRSTRQETYLPLYQDQVPTFIYLFICFLRYWGLNSGLHLEPLHQSFFCEGIFFEIGSRGTICLGWLRTSILLISAS